MELNAQQLVTGVGKRFDARAVQWVRYAHGIPLPPHSPFAEGELSVKEVAARLRVSDGAVYYWIEHGKLHARQTDTGRFAYPSHQKWSRPAARWSLTRRGSTRNPK